MTLPKGYIKPNKEAEERAKREAEERAKREAEERLSIPKAEEVASLNAKNLDKKSYSGDIGVDFTSSNRNYSIDYTLLLEQLKDAYIDTIKEATFSYFRLLDFWSQNYKKYY